jgi:hypothetical protein
MNCPIIENLSQAIAIGQALGDVMHYDRGWAERVFSARHTYQTGPKALNNELQSQWNDHWTEAEKKKILAKFVMYRLAR